ncbi:MAG: hypothetical protein R2820_15085 [Cyclobacteriaceae bacterium]|nr:hypothetical protein [Cyclobacteriaceae bacterium]
MVITIKKGATKAEIEKALAKLDSRRKVSLKKYFGSLKRGLDGLTYQKEARRED